MKIKDLPRTTSLKGVRFKHPTTKEICIWVGQWGYPDGKAGVFYKKGEFSTQIYPIFLDSLDETLEWEVME